MVGAATSNEATELQSFFKQTVMDETDGKWIPFPGGCSSYWLPFSDQVKPHSLSQESCDIKCWEQHKNPYFSHVMSTESDQYRLYKGRFLVCQKF